MNKSYLFKVYYYHWGMCEELYHEIKISYPSNFRGDSERKAWHDVIYRALNYLHENGGLDVLELCRIELLNG